MLLYCGKLFFPISREQKPINTGHSFNLPAVRPCKPTPFQRRRSNNPQEEIKSEKPVIAGVKY
jgi:hypothetical protein